MLNQIVRPAVRSVARSGTRAYHPPANFKQATMNDLPVPQGSWQANYEANQKKNNLHLAVGVVSLVATIVYAKVSGLIYLNYYPPTPKQ